MWFARSQILICEPQSIWRKLLLLSWLYLTSSKYVLDTFVIKNVQEIKIQLKTCKVWHANKFPCYKLLRFFFEFDTFFDNQFKNTSNLIFPGFKVPSKSFFPMNFKTGLTFWHMWFFNFQNLVRSCQHIRRTNST